MEIWYIYVCEQEHHDALFEEAGNYLSTSDEALDSLLSKDVVPLNKKENFLYWYSSGVD